MIVLDASAAVELICGTDAGRRVEESIGDEQVVAPALLLAEVASALRGLFRSAQVPEDQALASLRLLPRLPITWYASEELLEHVWQLRHRLTAYDAHYVALAERLDVPLVTCDRKLAAASARVIVV